MPEDANIQAEEQGQVEGNAEGQVEGNEGQQAGDSSGAEKPKEEPTITESALKARLRRHEKKIRDEFAEQQRLEQLSVEERARVEKEQAEERASKRIAQANQRLVSAEARGIAAELGIRQDRVAAALKFADLSEVEVSDDGEPDAPAIRAALAPVLNDFPEWGKPQVGKAPGNNPGGSGTVPKGLDAEIQAAQDANDYVKAERLYAQKLAQQGLLNHPT
jgi:hypothetical protein